MRYIQHNRKVHNETEAKVGGKRSADMANFDKEPCNDAPKQAKVNENDSPLLEEDNERFECDQCWFTSMTKVELTAHNKSKHTALSSLAVQAQNETVSMSPTDPSSKRSVTKEPVTNDESTVHTKSEHTASSSVAVQNETVTITPSDASTKSKHTPASSTESLDEIQNETATISTPDSSLESRKSLRLSRRLRKIELEASSNTTKETVTESDLAVTKPRKTLKRERFTSQDFENMTVNSHTGLSVDKETAETEQQIRDMLRKFSSKKKSVQFAKTKQEVTNSDTDFNKSVEEQITGEVSTSDEIVTNTVESISSPIKVVSCTTSDSSDDTVSIKTSGSDNNAHNPTAAVEVLESGLAVTDIIGELIEVAMETADMTNESVPNKSDVMMAETVTKDSAAEISSSAVVSHIQVEVVELSSCDAAKKESSLINDEGTKDSDTESKHLELYTESLEIISETDHLISKFEVKTYDQSECEATNDQISKKSMKLRPRSQK